jgi:hypothetical protein
VSEVGRRLCDRRFSIVFVKKKRAVGIRLMPQREVLGHDCGPRAKEGDEGPQEESNQAKHAERIRAENEPEEGRSGERRNLS